VKALSARPARTARPARSSRRLAAALVAGATAVAFLGGCGFQTRQQAAAVVNGEVISQADVQTTYEQLQTARYDFTENVVLTALIAAPLLESAVAPSGGFKPNPTYAQVMTAIPDATQSTKDFVAAVSLIQSQTMTPAEMEAYRAGLQKAEISVNPRFGEIVPSDEGPVYFSIGQSTPDWIKPVASPAPTPAS
jgi:hypothetical protein